LTVFERVTGAGDKEEEDFTDIALGDDLLTRGASFFLHALD